MDTTNFGAPAGTGLDPRVMWRAITDPALQTAAYVGVILWEAATALVLGAAVVLWIRERDTAPAFRNSVLALVTLVLLHLPTRRAEAA
jgi:predicted small integral membrane protein